MYCLHMDIKSSPATVAQYRAQILARLEAARAAGNAHGIAVAEDSLRRADALEAAGHR